MQTNKLGCLIRLVLVGLFVLVVGFGHPTLAETQHRNFLNDNGTKLEKATGLSTDTSNQICEMIQNAIDAATYSMDSGMDKPRSMSQQNTPKQSNSQKSLEMELEQSFQRFRVDLNLRSALLLRKQLLLISNDWLVYEVPNVNFESDHGNKMWIHDVRSVEIEQKWPVFAQSSLFRQSKSMIGAIYSMTHFIYFQLNDDEDDKSKPTKHRRIYNQQTSGLVYNIEKNTLQETAIYGWQRTANIRPNTRITTLNNEMFSFEINEQQQYLLVRWSMVSNGDLTAWSPNRNVLQLERKEVYYLYYRVNLLENSNVYRRIVVSKEPLKLDSGECQEMKKNTTDRQRNSKSIDNEKIEKKDEEETYYETDPGKCSFDNNPTKSLIPIRDWDNYQSGFVFNGGFVLFDQTTILRFSDIVVASVMKREFPATTTIFNKSSLIEDRFKSDSPEQLAISQSYIETSIQSISATEYFICSRLRLTKQVVIIAGLVAAIILAIIVSAIYWSNAGIIRGNRVDSSQRFNRSRNFQSISKRTMLASKSQFKDSLQTAAGVPVPGTLDNCNNNPSWASVGGSGQVDPQRSNSSGKFNLKSDGSFKTAMVVIR